MGTFAGRADELMDSRAEAAENLHDSDRVESSAFKVAPSRRPVAQAAHLPPVEPGQTGKGSGGEAAPDLGEPCQGGTFHCRAHASDAVPARNRFDGAPNDG